MVKGEESTIEKVVKEELDVKMMQMAEMLASLMARSGVKPGIEKELKTAFKTLMMETYAEVDRETGGVYYYCLDQRGERGLGSEYLSDYFSGAIQARPGSVV